MTTPSAYTMRAVESMVAASLASRTVAPVAASIMMSRSVEAI